MNKRLVLLVGILFIVTVSMTLVYAASPSTSSSSSSSPPPLQTCVMGTTQCVGYFNYECVSNNQWLLKEVNAISCGYTEPSVCIEEETDCLGFNEYTCLNNQWVLSTLNAESCDYVCTSGASYCDGVDLRLCSNNEWSIVENSPICGYMSPTSTQNYILTNSMDEVHIVGLGMGGTYSVDTDVDLGSLKTVTLHSGGVYGGAYCDEMMLPGVAKVGLCVEPEEEPWEDPCQDYIVTLPLYSDVTFENVRYIYLINTVIVPDNFADAQLRPLIFSNVVYSYS